MLPFLAQCMLVLSLNCQPLVCLSFLRLLLLSPSESDLCSGEWSTGCFGTSEAVGHGGDSRREQTWATEGQLGLQLGLLEYKVGSVILHRVVVRTKSHQTQIPKPLVQVLTC